MKYIIISAIAIIVIFLAVLSQIPIGIEPLTEVYFENHTALPSNVFLNKNYNFSFTIHNLEYQDMLYAYTINALDVNDSLISEVGNEQIILFNNESKTIFQSFSFKNHFDRSKIQIIINKTMVGEEPKFRTKLWWPDPNIGNQIDIHFWVDEIRGTTITIVPD